MKHKIIPIQTMAQAIEISDRFYHISGHRLPPDYYLDSESYLFFYDGKIVGGYLLNKNRAKRCLRQIPQSGYSEFCLLAWHCASELNSYFIVDKKHDWLMMLHGTWRVLRLPSKYLVLAYEDSNLKLEKVYSGCERTLLYSGKVLNLAGMTGDNFETIIMIRKSGFLKLFLLRLIRKAKKWISF